MADASQEPSPLESYLNSIERYEDAFKKWESRCTKILKKYRDEESNQAGVHTAKFNILWSNVQTLIPAVYAKLPKADVMRRFGDNDPVGRVASLLIERALDYEIEHYPDFRGTMRHDVEDRFLGGRGTAWIRYEPHVKAQAVEVTDDIEENEETEKPEEIEYECAPIDYVHWKDFGHSPANARTWEEVTAVWRVVYMDREALEGRFGDKAKDIPTNTGPTNLQNQKSKGKDQAQIYELWDKTKNKVFWLNKNVKEFVDERDDPLELEGFFPCPKPLYATTTSDSLIPVPDFCLYQDQANELDILSDRIDGLVKALRVRGVYDSTVPALKRLFTEGANNDLIPVEKWMAFAEKGGLKGAIDLVPLDMLAKALTEAYSAREQIKAMIYEITGISDIIRGETAASETATAQQIKGQYAGLRLRSMQDDVAMFATEILQLKAQVICTKYQDETILRYSAADQLSQADQQLIPQAIQLIRQAPLRTFRVEVAADSLVQIDENQMKQDRTEFLTAFGGFMEKALPVGQSSQVMVPVIVELMKFGIQAFKGARNIEGTLDEALEQMKAMAAQPQQPRPDPEMVKAQAEAQLEQQRAQFDAQMEQVRAQTDMQVEQQRIQMETKQKAQELQMQAMFDRWKAQLDAATKIEVAEITAKAGVDAAVIGSANQTVSGDLNG